MPNPTPPWDVFCRVVDNFGDVGVCWRLAADLASRGRPVRLRIDDAGALAWMAPGGAAGVEVVPWPDEVARFEPGTVVIETFGCELPDAVVAGMAAAVDPPVWINLEYLSAEDYVERSHHLASPQTQGVGAGLRKWFFYPGFTPRTGGLLREADLASRQHAFDAPAWLASHGLARRPDERIVSLFCYETAAVPALLDELSRQPSLLLVTAGAASRLVDAALGPPKRLGALRAALLPPLTQRDYDHLLWASDINFVRGEDSFVRAQWAGRPFVWQIYPQHDGAHHAKLDAFLTRFGAEPALHELWQAWNRPEARPASLPAMPGLDRWRHRCERWRDALFGQADLVTQLLGFVGETR